MKNQEVRKDSTLVLEEKLPSIPVFSSYREAMEAMRKHKDESTVKNGIIEKANVESFKGLNYFPPDSTFIFKAKLELLKPEKVIFKTTDSRAPEYYKFCKLNFVKDGKNSMLYGYVENINNPESLFVPFKDATSNIESYGGGRYMDIDYHGEKTMLLLDFNYAYNPYCHYNHDYSCPLVPSENILDIPINAGEKKLYE
ncbi:MAG: DUF1684 domain-containing protein [bacterium]|nr:DUF1684 domain-containing protein [bacterium]